MKIIGLVASPHGIKGNTAGLLDIVIEGAKSEGAKAQIISLPGDTVLPCKACDACHISGVCPQKDDFEEIKAKILDSDGLILASPNYIFSVSAQMKAFMDRCCGIIHCMGFEGRYGASVVTSGGGDEGPIADYLSHFLIITGIIPVGAVWANMGMIENGDFPKETHYMAFELGKRLVTCWAKKNNSPEIEKSKDAFLKRMKSLIQYRKEEWPYEYQYWKEHRNLK
ncbi:MAG: flavodoxin family protein [Thermodesulfobacteriota bacterium]|nr:flavodoxin family protein [Thermodesulfobacteriota bacterium]